MFRSVARTALGFLLLGSTLAPALPAQTRPLLPAAETSFAPKSGATAFALSLAGAALPLVMAGNSESNTNLALIGVLVGPALGHLYAGNGSRALAGVYVRGAILGIAALGVAAECGSGGGDWFCGLGPALAGGLGIMVSDIVDIVTAPASVKKYNDAHPVLVIRPMSNGPESRLGVGVRFGF